MVSVPPGLLAIGICSYQLAYPHVLHGVLSYDDGVYFGSAVYLIHGIVGYRDYVFTAPPGITLLMTPFGLLTHLTTTNNALAAARVFTAVVAGANAMLAGIVVRHRGVAASLAAATVLAIFPSAYFADSTVLLEPYLVFFCLLGIALLFQNGDIATPRRVWIAGLAFGFGGTVRLWAAVPFVIAVAFCVPVWRRAILPLLGGAVIGFGVPCLPFFLLAPTAFVRDTLSTQLTRVSSGVVPTAGTRFLNLTGLGSPLNLNFSGRVAVEVGVGAAAVFGLVLVAALATARANRLEWFAYTCMIATTLAIMLPANFYDRYSYFVAPFVAIVFGLSARYLLEALTWIGQRVAGGAVVSVDFVVRTGLTLIVVAIIVAGAATAVRRESTYTRSWFASVTRAPGPVITQLVPPGSCVVTDMSALVLSGNRFSAGMPGCPTLLDSLGTWLVADPEHPPPYRGRPERALVSEWRNWLAQADYVVLSGPDTFRIPWTPALQVRFDRAFVSVSDIGGVAIYRRSDTGALTAALTTAASVARSG